MLNAHFTLLPLAWDTFLPLREVKSDPVIRTVEIPPLFPYSHQKGSNPALKNKYRDLPPIGTKLLELNSNLPSKVLQNEDIQESPLNHKNIIFVLGN
jgi:hypothetical protein